MALLKHSSVEADAKWWFLYETAAGVTPDLVAEEGLDTCRRIRAVRFLKRFRSEEELEIEAAVKYGVSPIDIDYNIAV